MAIVGDLSLFLDVAGGANHPAAGDDEIRAGQLANDLSGFLRIHVLDVGAVIEILDATGAIGKHEPLFVQGELVAHRAAVMNPYRMGFVATRVHLGTG